MKKFENDRKVDETFRQQGNKTFPLTLEFHVRDLIRLVSGRFPAIADDEVNIGVLLVVVAAGSVLRLVVHGHADSFGLEPPAAPRRSASLMQFSRLPGLAITRGYRDTKMRDLGTKPLLLALTTFFCVLFVAFL